MLSAVRRSRGVVGAALIVAVATLVLLGVLFGPVVVADTYGGINGIGLLVMIVVGVAGGRSRGRR